ncbi:Arsenite efflux pump ArsB, ACR3 family [Caloramator fervidus]|uniref:Arsenite efflux pump ArsB, ACR3 family n=1 Tax=Caloramator fervidus TaxID=29344 RepID=A0A1H5WVA6_9CLOT|nr:bile acid:sodium symporter [Caloramator fervidus]SEG03046.1 Arsenite efflux pump ArsB, ACR3 family [Caloramator fervidus]
MFKKIFYYPSKNLVKVIPLALLLGFLIGLKFDLNFMKNYILIFTIFMIYPTMIGFNYKSAFDLSHLKLVLLSLIINFLIIPVVAYIIGITLFKNNMDMFAGLAIASLLPTSGMTISWTMINKGNVSAAVKITALSLFVGSLVAPWYLFVMVGQYIPIDIVKTFITIIQVVIIPLILGDLTYRIITKKYSKEEYDKKIKPILPAISIWFLLGIVFISIGMKAKVIISKPNLILWALLVLIVFYLINYTISVVLGKIFLNKEDAIALVYSTVMRNLSLALGIAASNFGAKAALIVTLAFVLQVQSASWFGKYFVNNLFKN